VSAPNSLASGALSSALLGNSNALRHGGARNGKRTKTYDAWSSARGRCRNPNHRAYARYGGRGIQFSELWDKFEDFLADMGEAPPGTTLDRKENNGNYEPGNCRWATWEQQNNNQRSNRLLRCYAGDRGQKSMSQWSRISGTHVSTIFNRLNRGLSDKEAVFGRAR
jgi:hypothetical protein